MATMKKLRSDSKFAVLTEEQREELDAMLLGGKHSLEEVRAWLAPLGVEVSLQSISEYRVKHAMPGRWGASLRLAAALNKVGAEGVSEAARTGMTQRVFELMTDPTANPKEVQAFYRLFLQGEKNARDERKLALLEKRAAAADAAKAALEAKVAAGGLSPEALHMAEEALNLL